MTPSPAHTSGAVFLSYASQDAAAARCLCEALRAAGIEVWFDQSELVGGDAWDGKIRRQIKACELFVPVISANTQARREGYFRLEWKLAAQRTHTIADGTPFLLPVVIDATHDAEALVPEEFRAVQWTRLPEGQITQPFVERVRKLLAGSIPEALSHCSAERSAGAATPATQPSPPNVGRRVPAAAWAGAIAVIAIGVGAAFFATRNPSSASPNAGAMPRPPAEAAAIDSKSIAVLAFANMSADKENTEYFSDGISEEILNALDRIPALRVTPRTSSFYFKDKNVPLDEIGRVLRVANVIEGSVRKAGSEVRITVKLLNAVNGARVWAEEFRREMTPANMFAVQGEIAVQVAQKLSVTVASPSSIAGAAAGIQTRNQAAYDTYLRARALQTGGMSRANALEMLRLYQEAVRFDPNYALAWARLSQAYVRIRTGGRDRSEQNATGATNAATTALRLAPTLPEAHLAMANVHLFVDYDLDAAQRELDETERLRPNDAEVPAYRVSLEEARGHWGDDLARLIARAAGRDPQNADHIYLLGRKLTVIGRYAEAEVMYERASAISPTGSQNRWLANNYVAWTGDVARASAIYDAAPPSDLLVLRWDRARLRAMNGDISGAIADFEKTFGDFTHPAWMRGYSAYYAAQLEQRRNNMSRAHELFATALAAAQQSLTELPDDEVSASLLTLIHAARGERAEALAALDEATRLAARTKNARIIADLRVERAETLMLLGDRDAAIAELRALHEMGRAFGYRLRRDLQWEPLRANPKFQQLMKEAEARADAQPSPKK